jgi:hypothetical protein
MLGRLRDSDIGPDVIHRDRATNGSNEEHSTSPERIDEIQEPDESTNKLNCRLLSASEERLRINLLTDAINLVSTVCIKLMYHAGFP